jgi:putative ATPase
LSAVDAGVADLRAAIENSKHQDEPDIVFVDEVHRLNKGQQDVLLPAVEFRHIRLLAATTENPYHSVNHALRSRALVFELKPHRDSDLVQLMRKILDNLGWQYEPTALQHIASAAGGDARQAVNFLEALMALSADKMLEATGLESLSVNRHTGDDRYHDLLSAMIKSLRASAVDAALLYCGSLVANQVDPRIIARRLVIFASEDVGNASPMALVVATSALQAVSMIGYPEARIILGQAVCYLAAAPKSNRAYVAIDAAIADAQQPFAVPEFISTIKRGYVYPHDDPEGARAREYLPADFKGRRYYAPSDSGHEKSLGVNLTQQGPKN